MKIAVEGCAHGELDKIYDSLKELEAIGHIKIDLLLCCGDFQATRNHEDLNSMAVPPKYRHMCSFHKYYSGEKTAPVLTIFIGGNHEASSHLQELPYGGWVAPNIYYLGTAGVVNLAGLRIAGISGIFKAHDFHRGRFEAPPYSESMKKSVYHVRSLDVFRLKQLSNDIDIFLSHDWPQGIHAYGNLEELTRRKPFLREDIESNKLGSPPNTELMAKLQPSFWFSGHLHVEFAAVREHKSENDKSPKVTKFLALDKCLPRRKFLRVIDIKHDESKPLELEYDLEWLSILHYTNHLISIEQSVNYMPASGDDERWIFTPTESEKNFVLSRMEANLKVPINFYQSAPVLGGKAEDVKYHQNEQTTLLCSKLGIDNPLKLLIETKGPVPETSQQRHSLQNSSLTSSFMDSEPSAADGSDSSAGNSNEVDETEEPIVPSPRSSLVLPPPKFDADPAAVSMNDDKGSSQPDHSSLFIIDEGIPSPPRNASKKFKRRNHNLYGADDED